MPAKDLPPRPDLEQYRKQAKELVKEFEHSSQSALERFRRYHPRLQRIPDFAVTIKLSDAQLVIAREHAFESWPKFLRHLRNLQQANAARPAEATNTTPSVERIRAEEVELAVEVVVPQNARGLVVFACVSGTSRYDPRNRYVTGVLNASHLGTLLADLLTEDEEIADVASDELKFDIALLSRRIVAVTDWLTRQPQMHHLPMGYCGSGTAAAAALVAAAQRPDMVRAIVSSGGRPDLAGPALGRVHAPTLLTVGGRDALGLGFNYSSMTPFPRETVLGFERIDGTSQSFEEQGALEKSAMLARDWFLKYLSQPSTVGNGRKEQSR